MNLRFVSLSLFLVLSTTIPALAVQPAAPSSAQSDPQFQGQSDTPKDAVDAQIQHNRIKALNKERQELLKKDTDKLLQLATELKESVDKSSVNTLSLEVIRKTEEIEKLARKVRDKMKDAY